MPYYRGDNYYRGDYYRGGDFLGLGKLVGGIAKVAGGVASSLFRASPVGQVVSTVANLVHPSLPAPKSTALQIASMTPQQSGLINIGSGSQSGLLNIGGGGPGPASLLAGIPGAGGMMKGYHLNKSTYETRGGGTSRWGGQGLQVHPKGSVLVRNRRMNVGNARALKKALRRAGGFARLARRVMTFTHPRAGRGRFKFKARAKR